MQRRQIWRIGIALGIAALAVVLAAGVRTSLKSESNEVPTTKVKRGNLDIHTYSSGELSAQHFSTLIAPPIGGGTLQITHLAHTGTHVKAGDLIVEFDPSEQEYKVEQSLSQLQQAEQDIAKANADATVQVAQDKSALLKAKFDVRRAELEVSRNELVSAIDAKKNELTLSEAKRGLDQLEHDIQSHAASNQAGIAVAREKYAKAELAMTQAKENIGKMKVVAPMDGLAVISKNELAAENSFFGGGMGNIPDYREGDQAEPGSIVAQVVDPKGMDITAKVGEVERGNLQIGQPAEIRLDALPGVTYHGKIKAVSGSAAGKAFWEVGRNFQVTVEFVDADARLRPGYTARLVFVGTQRKDVLYLPRPAIFKKDEKPVVYVKSGSGFVVREIKINFQTESRAAVEGMKVGTEVALINPETQGNKVSSGSGTDSVLPAGGTP